MERIFKQSLHSELWQLCFRGKLVGRASWQIQSSKCLMDSLYDSVYYFWFSSKMGYKLLNGMPCPRHRLLKDKKSSSRNLWRLQASWIFRWGETANTHSKSEAWSTFKDAKSGVVPDWGILNQLLSTCLSKNNDGHVKMRVCVWNRVLTWFLHGWMAALVWRWIMPSTNHFKVITE